MTYIILAAGTGSRLHPITLKHPKTLFSLDDETTILQRMVGLIKGIDPTAEIVVVCGFQHHMLKKYVSGVQWIYNPFYEVTNSLASLWFARAFLSHSEVTLINGDVVISEKLMHDIVTKHTDKPTVLIDSSIKQGDYNVQVEHDKVIVMSKELTHYTGEYAGITKLDVHSLAPFQAKLCEMVEDGIYRTWYEDALVQMIFEENFSLYAKDISAYEWTEVDSVDDLLYAKRIHAKEKA